MASALIGALRIVLGMDSAAFEEGLSLAEKKLNQFGKRMDKLGGSLQKWGAGLTLAVTTPLAALGKGFVQAASDASETASAFDQLFKDQAGATRAWADATAKALGRSTYALQEQALAFQQYFSQVAPTNEQAAELSRNFTQLAQDLASFYNVSESDALEKLRSGLSGEAEPLRAFGVFLNDAAVQAKALEMGLSGTNNELTEQEKVLVRAALIMEQTSAAQGDVARTSDSFANRQKALSAAINDVGIKLGTILLPFAEKVVDVLVNLTQAFSELSPETQGWVVAVAGIVAALGPALIALGAMVSGLGAIAAALPALGAAFVALTGPIGLAVAAIAAVAAAWVYWDEIKAAFPGFVTVVETSLSAIGALLDGFVEHMRLVGTLLVQILTGDLAGAWTTVQTMIQNFVDTFVNVANTVFPGAVDAIVAKVQAIWQAFVEMKDRAIAAVQALVNGVQEWLIGKLTAVLDTVKSKITAVGDTFYNLYDAVVGHSYIPDMVTEIGAWMGQLQGNMVAPAVAAAGETESAFEGVGSSIESVFSGFGSSIAEAIKGTKEWSDVLADVLSKIGDIVIQKAFGGLGGGGGGGGGGQGGFLSGLLGGLVGFAGGGSFKVGGAGGIDSQIVAFRASPTETVDIRKPGQDGGGGVAAVAVGVSVDDDGRIQAYVRRQGEASAQAGAAMGVAQVRREFPTYGTQMQRFGRVGG